MEELLSLTNNELQMKYQKIKVVDEKIDEAEYGVKRRRGTLISLQKMSEKRTERFGFERNDKRKVDIYKNVNEGKKKYLEKKKLDFQRKLFEFKKTVRTVEDHGINVEQIAQAQKLRMKEVIQRFEKEKDHIRAIL